MLKRKIKAIQLLLLGFKESNYNDACIYFEQAHKLLYFKDDSSTLNLKRITPKTYTNG